MTAPLDDKTDSQKTNEKKWGKAMMAAGFTVFPSIILEKQHALGLEPMDINIILQLARYWWEADDLPRPSKSTLATLMGVHMRTVQRHIARLEDLGFIQRIPRKNKYGGNNPNEYELTGLIKKTEPFAIEALEERRKRAAEKKAGMRRKNPRLHVVRGGGA